MKCYNNPVQQRNSFRKQAEIEVLNSAAELLSISFEKYNTEVIHESGQYLDSSVYFQEPLGLMTTEIDFEDIIKNKNKIEVTLSGEIKGQHNYQETFILFFILHSGKKVRCPWKPHQTKDKGANSLCLQFDRKIAQISDSILRASWSHELPNGNTRILVRGRGILSFTSDQTIN